MDVMLYSPETGAQTNEKPSMLSALCRRYEILSMIYAPNSQSKISLSCNIRGGVSEKHLVVEIQETTPGRQFCQGVLLQLRKSDNGALLIIQI